MGSLGNSRLRRALGAGLCCAGLVLAGVLGTTDGSTMPPADPGDGGSQAAVADGPLPQCQPCLPASSRTASAEAARPGPVG